MFNLCIMPAVNINNQGNDIMQNDDANNEQLDMLVTYSSVENIK